MYNNLNIINKITHKNAAVKEIASYEYAKTMINAPITVAEFFEACKDYPILFAKDANENWMATVMLGYKENENLFIDSDGKWEQPRYIPAHIRRYPFIFVNQPNSTELTLAIDGDFLNDEATNASRKLFKEENVNSDFLNGVLDFLNQFQNDAVATAEFIKQLDKWELLEEKHAVLQTKDGKFNIGGFYTVNEEKLKHLSKKKKDEICNHNALALITAHLISLSNIQRLSTK